MVQKLITTCCTHVVMLVSCQHFNTCLFYNGGLCNSLLSPSPGCKWHIWRVIVWLEGVEPITFEILCGKMSRFGHECINTSTHPSLMAFSWLKVVCGFMHQVLRTSWWCKTSLGIFSFPNTDVSFSFSVLQWMLHKGSTTQFSLQFCKEFQTVKEYLSLKKSMSMFYWSTVHKTTFRQLVAAVPQGRLSIWTLSYPEENISCLITPLWCQGDIQGCISDWGLIRSAKFWVETVDRGLFYCIPARNLNLYALSVWDKYSDWILRREWFPWMWS